MWQLSRAASTLPSGLAWQVTYGWFKAGSWATYLDFLPTDYVIAACNKMDDNSRRVGKNKSCCSTNDQMAENQLIETFLTHTEECNVVVDEVMDDAGFLWRLSPSLEQAGGEDRGQLFTRHLVEVGTLLNPESQTEAWLEEPACTCMHTHMHTLTCKHMHTHTSPAQ